MDTPEETWGSTRTPSSRPASQKSTRSSRSGRSQRSGRATEQTPLLAQEDRLDDGQEDEAQTPATTSLLRSLSGSSGSGKAPLWKRRWPSILALVVLCIVIVAIMLGFLATEGIEEYAMQAAQFQPTKLSLDGLTDHGAKVHVEGDFKMDASRVKKQSVRNLGRFGTWIAREAETGPTDVNVYLPEYGNVLIGKANVPGVKVNIRNGHTTHVSLVATLEPGSLDGIRSIAHDWIDGRLGQIRLKGKAYVPLKSGLITLGKQTIEQSMVFNGGDIPTLPHYNITKLNLREAEQGMGADASIVVTNDFPVQITLPPVAVDVLIDGCSPSDNPIVVGTAETGQLEVRPKTDIEVNVTGNVERLSDSLTEVCPDSAKSPLDAFLGDYMKGEDATIYINCCQFPDPSTPSWAHDLLKDITVPVPFAGRDMGNLIKNFSLADVQFHLPNPFAEPGTPEAAPKISAVVKVDIGLPNEMNFPLDVNQVKADADIFYHKKKLGKLNLEKWQKANSTRVEGHGGEGPSLLVESDIKKAPIEILDDDLFSEVVQALLFGGKSVMMDINAAVSVGVDTPVGKFAVRGIPAQGVVPVKPIRGGNGGNGDDDKNKPSAVNLKIGNLSIVGTSPTSIILQAHLNLTNPTNYSATVPYFNINILVNGTKLGQATVEDIEVHPGNNTNLLVSAVWDPLTNGGEKGKEVGRELLSQYVSGYNTSLTLQAHRGSIPAQPALGELLSNFPIMLPAPHLSTPKEPSDGDDPSDPDDPDKPDDSPHFIRDATMHLITSTAVFTLSSPFSSTTMFITSLNATAYHDGNPSGKILYELPFAVPPGLSETPRLPVDWSLGSVGYEAIRKALGGQLKLSAFAHVGIRIGEWRETIWFQGGKIGANVRL
ncbi:Nn.00g064970.m01.CDS01 [Neocucurbitaria sp. VM-36]